MSKRRILDVLVEDYVSLSGLLDYHNPDGLIEVMKMYKERYAGRDIYFHTTYCGYDGGSELSIRERREENDEEFNARIQEETRVKEKQKKTKATRDAKERAEYERLKKKYEESE